MLFPWPGFFEQVALADVYLYLDDVQFSKGSFTNRIQLLNGSDRQWMTIPLAGKGSFQKIAELSAATDGWKDRHREMLRHSLKDAPYLADAIDLLDAAYRHESVTEILMASIELPAAYLGVNTARESLRTSRMAVEGSSSRRVLDLVLSVGGTRYLTGHGAANYLDHAEFERCGVQVEYMQYSKTPWPQPAENFTPYVSILDLIARVGPAAREYLAPLTLNWRDYVASL